MINAINIIDWDHFVQGAISTVVYAGLGLVLFCISYLLLVFILRRHNLNKHIDDHNTAAGIAVAGFLVAVALVVSGAIH